MIVNKSLSWTVSCNQIPSCITSSWLPQISTSMLPQNCEKTGMDQVAPTEWAMMLRNSCQWYIRVLHDYPCCNCLSYSMLFLVVIGLKLGQLKSNCLSIVIITMTNAMVDCGQGIAHSTLHTDPSTHRKPLYINSSRFCLRSRRLWRLSASERFLGDGLCHKDPWSIPSAPGIPCETVQKGLILRDQSPQKLRLQHQGMVVDPVVEAEKQNDRHQIEADMNSARHVSRLGPGEVLSERCVFLKGAPNLGKKIVGQ